MNNIKLVGILRSISIIIILFVIFLYIMLNTLLDDVVSESSDSQPEKNYEYRAGSVGTSIPNFNNNLESIFPGKIIPKVVEVTIVSEPAAPVDIPSLQFIGMIETDKKIIYSFRNIDTNKLLLFEEGVVLEGITLVFVEDKKYIFKKNEVKFRVDKK